ncbi:UDP-N-acetyl-D-mannosamine dehydrogenase [Gammaproteobacteria bacterium]|nr:UDP-N-acetyl-D-mannosamine dehydrogenase [Gammaproteobacteria bacterium]
MSKILSVVGLGYIGLPTAAMFASEGCTVIGVDVNQETIDTVNAGRIHIVEPQLEKLVKNAVSNGLLRATNNPETADIFFIAVPTPFKKRLDKNSIPEPDLRYIESASRSIAKVLKKGNLVILESTSPVGTTEQMSKWMEEERPDLTFPHSFGDESNIRVAHCPERVLPGQVIKELVENDRLIGGVSPSCSDAAVEIYKVFVKGECIITNARTAEMAKLTENASRDVSIAFANELSIICDSLDINVWELIRLANRHPRVNILNPGPGVGGHCIAVDPWFIASKSPQESHLITSARNINDSKPKWVLDKIKNSIFNFLAVNPSISINDVVVACYGLAFKPNIDDLRESPSVGIVTDLIESHPGKILAVEPNIDTLPNILNSVELTSAEIALERADIHVMLVKHDEFAGLAITSDYLIDTIGISS